MKREIIRDIRIEHVLTLFSLGAAGLIFYFSGALSVQKAQYEMHEDIAVIKEHILQQKMDIQEIKGFVITYNTALMHDRDKRLERAE